jgi:3-oxoacyl-[acyl-carrier protein] reductase
MKRFKSNVVFVTGASRGIGRAIAKQFAIEGALVGIGYRRFEKDASQTLEEIKKEGGQGEIVRLDVRQSESVTKALTSFINKNGKIDILINNAALLDDKPIALMSEKSWSAVIETNLGGVFNCTRTVVRSMISQKAGVIVNIGSISGMAASPGQANYAASKGGIVSLTKTLGSELALYNIRVNAVIPGMFTEGMAQKLDRRKAQAYKERIPLARFGSPEELAKVVTFLASEDASYIVGQAVVVDGGLTL